MQLLTLGHGTASEADLAALLRANHVHSVIDVRSVPKSRAHQHVWAERMAHWIPISRPRRTSGAKTWADFGARTRIVQISRYVTRRFVAMPTTCRPPNFFRHCNFSCAMHPLREPRSCAPNRYGGDAIGGSSPMRRPYFTIRRSSTSCTQVRRGPTRSPKVCARSPAAFCIRRRVSPFVSNSIGSDVF